jgi:hypothetical protein
MVLCYRYASLPRRTGPLSAHSPLRGVPAQAAHDNASARIAPTIACEQVTSAYFPQAVVHRVLTMVSGGTGSHSPISKTV